MDRQIREFVDECGIYEKKEKLIETKKRLFKLEREMADLAFDYEVGTYVHMLDECNDLRIKKRTASGREAVKIKNEISSMEKVLKKMENNSKIIEYLECKKEYLSILKNIGKYEKSINTDFRNCFYDYDVPNIFVFQGYVGKNKEIVSAKNIILPDTVALYRKVSDVVIYPVEDNNSNRVLRHFYNRVSFKYLEEMTKDFNFDLQGKNIGKIRVKK